MGGTPAIDNPYKQKRYEECVAHSRLCKTFGEFAERFPSDSNFYKSHDFKLPWLSRIPPPIKYTDEYIFSVARKYKYKKDFRENNNSLYATARRRGLVEKMTWLKAVPDLFSPGNCVYRYFFRELGAVYVGRTINPKARDKEHRDSGKSPVFKYARSQGVEMPKMQILRKNLTAEQSQTIEDLCVQRYRKKGLIVLNKGATGLGVGSLGMKLSISKHSLEKIARQYITLQDFQREHPKYFRVASRHGWLREWDFLSRAFRPDGIFTKKYCLEVAKRYSSRMELRRNDGTVYNKLLEKGWMRFCTWFSKRRTLTHDYCMTVARRCKCVRELYKYDSAVCYTIYRKGWIKECTWLETPGPSENHMRKVAQYTKQGQLVARYKSLADAGRATGVNDAKIGLVCMGKRHSAGGFVWKYIDGDT